MGDVILLWNLGIGEVPALLKNKQSVDLHQGVEHHWKFFVVGSHADLSLAWWINHLEESLGLLGRIATAPSDTQQLERVHMQALLAAVWQSDQHVVQGLTFNELALE